MRITAARFAAAAGTKAANRTSPIARSTTDRRPRSPAITRILLRFLGQHIGELPRTEGGCKTSTPGSHRALLTRVQLNVSAGERAPRRGHRHPAHTEVEDVVRSGLALIVDIG